MTEEPASCPTTFSSLQPAVRSLWAKSNDHGLLAHMLDVAAVAEALLQVEPRSSLVWVARALGLTLEQLPRWLAALVGLHDFGKSGPSFQSQWLAGLQRALSVGLTFGAAKGQDMPHALATALLLEPLLLRHVPSRDWVRHVLQAISAHHGYHLASAGLKLAREGREWGSARQALFETYWSVLNPPGAPEAEELSTPAVEWLAGLTSVADWIGSNVEWFPPGERYDRFEDYFEDAKRRACTALQAIGWTGFRALLEQSASVCVDTLIERIVQRPDQVRTARPLQRAADRLLSGTAGPALLLVEAPMGEGKTELAFLAHLRLQAANGHRGLFVALPTRATGNALFTRALTFLRAFAGQQPIDMQLVQGGASMNEQVRHLHGICGAEGERAENVSASAWFSQRRRPLLSPYGVGTIDQALFAVLNVKHHFVRLWGLGNRVVVLDEVHAYDTYTTGLIEALLGWLRALGSSVVLMSATLPRARRDALLQAWGSAPEQIPELPYPRLVLADERGSAGATFDARPMPSTHL